MWRARVEAHDAPMFTNSYEMTRALVAERQRPSTTRPGSTGSVGSPAAPAGAARPRQRDPQAAPRRRRRSATPLLGRLNRTIDDVLVGRAGLSPVMVGREADLGRLRSPLRRLAGPVDRPDRRRGRHRQDPPRAGARRQRPARHARARRPGRSRHRRPADGAVPRRPRQDRRERQPRLRRRREGPEPLRRGAGAGRRSTSSRSLSEGGPGLIVFEDLHWADAESLSTFELLGEPDRGPLVLVGTYRPDGLSRRHPAADLLPRLDRRHLVTHVQLGRLGPAEVNEFLAAVFEEDPPYRAVEALHSRTGGNPFFLEELVAGAGDMTHRGPRERAAAVDGGRGGAPPGRRPRPRGASGGVGRCRCSVAASRSTSSPR